jgi:sialate O-acetylesterase
MKSPALVLASVLCGHLLADVRLPQILSDGCVLQQDTDAAIFGFASPGEAVAVKASWGGSGETKAGPDGRWLVRVKTPKATDAKGPQQFIVTGNNTVTVSDVLIGEVWLCGGQSNMWWPIAESSEPQKEMAAANFPGIRLFTVEQEMSLWPRADNQGSWSATTPKSVERFSAVGYAFGREIHTNLGVPVGLIHCNWGGTRIEPWLSPTAIAKFPHTQPAVALANLLRDPNRRADAAGSGLERWWGTFDAKSGVDPAWASPQFDDAAWKTIPVPASWNAQMPDGLGAFDGVVYHRVAFDVPPEHAGKPAKLTLGPIDDRDEALINGVRVGGTLDDGEWNTPRQYPVNRGVLVAGRNVLAVRVLDTAGLGGIGGTGSTPDMLAIAIEGGPRIPLAGTWKFTKGSPASRLGTPSSIELSPMSTPSGLYHGMISTLLPHTLRGALWYQGEFNRGDGPLYADMLTTLFADWRAAFQSPDMHFGVVQLAPYFYQGDTGQTASIREAQERAVSGDPRVGLVVTMDIGDPKDIHPRNKREVGRRLSLWARNRVYGNERLPWRSPWKGSTSVERDAIRIGFGDGDRLQTTDGQPPRHFLIAGVDKKFVRADATIDGQTVLVRSPRVPQPVAVRYAWDDDAETNLINIAGLPAAPFRTDVWDDATIDLSVAVEQFRGTDSGLDPIFNGKDLSGWVNVNCAPETFAAAVDETGQPIIRCTGLPTGVIRTAEMYQNFVFEMEWRHHKPGGNAGLFVWSDGLTARGQPFTRSVEVQVMDGLEGDWYTSDGDIFPIHGAKMTPLNPRPKGGDRAFPTERRMNPSPAWNHYRVECVDGTISLAVNGKVVTRGKDITPRKGYICLEAEGSPIDFRKLRLKRLPASASPLTPDQVANADEGWVPLYTGVDLRGWKVPPGLEKHWQVKDWVLDFDGKGDHLWSEKSYKDFEMIADWRWTRKPVEAEYPVILPSGLIKKDDQGNPVYEKVMSAGDSGIYLRGVDTSQVNIWCWPIGSGEVYGYRDDPNMPADVRASVTPKVKADRPLGEWNRFHIVMKGDRLTVTLNGVKVLDQARLPGVPPEGPIALQNHGDPIQFANLFIRELK